MPQPIRAACRALFLVSVPVLLLTNCAQVPGPGGFTALEAARIPAPEGAPEGSCWAQDVEPAVIETTTTQVLVSPARLDEDGTQLAPAQFRTESRQEIIQPRRPFQFETLCQDALTPDFIASLQRALQVRGYYDAPITGTFDAPTSAALLAYQRIHNLETSFLTLETARAFGLAPAAF